jgi:hypothetical protein
VEIKKMYGAATEEIHQDVIQLKVLRNSIFSIPAPRILISETAEIGDLVLPVQSFSCAERENVSGFVSPIVIDFPITSDTGIGFSRSVACESEIRRESVQELHLPSADLFFMSVAENKSD